MTEQFYTSTQNELPLSFIQSSYILLYFFQSIDPLVFDHTFKIHVYPKLKVRPFKCYMYTFLDTMTVWDMQCY